METLSKKIHEKKTAPIKILQFGEGNFLRAFVDWMIQEMNDSGKYSGHVALVQPLPQGRVRNIMEQDGLYTLILQGIKNGEATRQMKVIDVIDDAVDPYTDYQKFLDYGASKDLEVVISNTTEAGICFEEKDASVDFKTTCPTSYPGKLLALLKHRYETFGHDHALAIIPCELIDDNGDKLKEVLIKLAKERKEDEDFISYLDKDCAYTSTLVDRIVPGFPRDEFDDLTKQFGYIDNNMVKAEIFDLYVLKSEPRVEKVFPVHKFDLEAYYVEDIHPYKKRKVRVLNGAHTTLVPVAYLSGFNEVRESLLDETIYNFLNKEIFEEIVPTIDVKGIESFAKAVFDRFLNPYVHHQLMSIALNSWSKYKERDLPTVLDNIKEGKTPRHMLFALACLILFYRGKRIKNGVEEDIKLADSAENIAYLRKVWDEYDGDTSSLVKKVLSNPELLGEDLTTNEVILSNVTKYLDLILKNGVYESIKGI